jgi:membrane-bound ClpP family serine protease
VALIIIGIVCLILAAVIPLAILWTIGIICIVIGLILVLLSFVPSYSGRWYGRRRYW